MCSRSDSRTYLETYLKNTNRLIDLKNLKSVPDNKFIEHAGWIARMLSRGVPLTKRSYNHMNAKLVERIKLNQIVGNFLLLPEASISIQLKRQRMKM